MAGPPPDPNPVEQPLTGTVPDWDTLGTLTHDPQRQTILDTIQRLARSPLTLPNAAATSSFVFPVSIPSRMSREHVDSLLHADYFVYERAVGVRLLMLILRPEDGMPGNQVFLINASKTVRRVVFPCPNNQSSTHHETLIDGCLVVDRGQNGAPDNLRFLCLDILAVQGRTDVAAKPLDRRLGTLDMEVVRPHRNLNRLRRTSSSALHSPSEAPSAVSATAASPTAVLQTFPFVLSLQMMERSYGLVKVLDHVIPSSPHACQGLVFVPVRQPFKPGPCADTYHWIPPRTVTFLVNTVRAGDRIESDLDPRSPHTIADTILTDPIAFKVLARLPNDPEGRLRGVGRVDLDRSTLAAWSLEPPTRRYGVFAWDTYSLSGLSAAGGWKWVRWIAAEDNSLADTIDDACRAIEEARNGVPDGMLRAKMESIRSAWKTREAQQASHGAALGQNRSASTDQLTSPTSGEFARERDRDGMYRKRAMSYVQPPASSGSTPTSTPSVVPPWQQQQQQHAQSSAYYTGTSSSGHRPWLSSFSQPPLSPQGSEFRPRSDYASAPPSSAPAPVDRLKSPTSPTPTSAAGLPPKPPPLINMPIQRPRERERDQETGGFGPPPPMPPYLGLPRRRSVSESQEQFSASVGLGRVNTTRTGDSEDTNRDQRSLSGSDPGGTGVASAGLSLPPKPLIVSSDSAKKGSCSGFQDAAGMVASRAGQPETSEPDPRSPTPTTHVMTDYANSTAAKLRSQPAPEPIPLNRRRSSTGPTPAMLAAVDAATASAGSNAPPEPQPKSPSARSRRHSSLSLAIDTSSAHHGSSPRSPMRPSSPLRPKTPLSGSQLGSHSPKSPTERNGRGRAGRVSRLSSPNKHTPSPGRVIAVLASGEVSDTSSGIPMDLDSNMAVGFGPSSSPDPRPGLAMLEGERVDGRQEVALGTAQSAAVNVAGDQEHADGTHPRASRRQDDDDMDVDVEVLEQSRLQGQEAAVLDGPGVSTTSRRLQSPPVKSEGDVEQPLPSDLSKSSPPPLSSSATQFDSHAASTSPAKSSSSPPRAVPSRPMRHALGIASPTQPVSTATAAPAATVPMSTSGIPAPLPPGVAVSPRAPSPPPKSQLAALLTTSSSSSSPPVPMPHVPALAVPPVLAKVDPGAPAAATPTASTAGGRKRKQPVSSESSPSIQSIPPTRPKRSRKGSAVELADTPVATESLPSPPSAVVQTVTLAVVATQPPPSAASTVDYPLKSSVPTSQSLLFGPGSVPQSTPAASNGRTSPLSQSVPPESAPPPLRIDTSVVSTPPLGTRLGHHTSTPALWPTSTLPSATQGGLSYSGSQASLSNATKMSFAFLLNDSGDDAMDTSPDSSPVSPADPSPPRPQPPSPVAVAPTAPAARAATSVPMPTSKSTSRRSDFDHEMTDEDVAALLTSMQSPSNVRPATAASSTNQSRQPTPRSASSTSQPPFSAPAQHAAGVAAQRSLSDRSLPSQKPQQPPPPVATYSNTVHPPAPSMVRQHSGSSSQPPTPRQQSFYAASVQQQAQQQQVQQQMRQQRRRSSIVSMSEHSQGYTPGYPPTHGPPPPAPAAHGYAPQQQPSQAGRQPQYPIHVQVQQPPHQPPYRPAPVMSPKAYHFTMNPANMPASPASGAPPSHSPPPVAYTHDPGAPPSATIPTGVPPAHYAPYGYQGQSHPPATYPYGYPQTQQPPTPTHHQHPQLQLQHQQAQAQGQYHQQLQQQQFAQAQAQAQYMAAMQQQQQQQQLANGYPQPDPYGRRPSYPGPNPQPPLPPGYPAPPGPR